jgi:hypothetical protein
MYWKYLNNSSFCIRAKKCIFFVRLSFLADAQSITKQEEDKKHFWQRCTYFLCDRTNYTFIFLIYLFQIDTFIIHHILTIFYSIFYQLANKTRNLLLAKQLLIYISYDDRTIIGFVGLIVNLLNRPADGDTVRVRKVRPKKSYFSST